MKTILPLLVLATLSTSTSLLVAPLTVAQTNPPPVSTANLKIVLLGTGVGPGSAWSNSEPAH